MRHLTLATALVAVLVVQGVSAQTRMKPTAPGTPGDPTWQGVVRLSDGRTFVTDGGLAIDAAVVKTATLPERELPGKVLETYLGGEFEDECRLSDLSAAASGKTYTTPSGVALNGTYISYLRRTLPAASVRLRTTGPGRPVTIVSSGAVVGVLMPVKQ